MIAAPDRRPLPGGLDSDQFEALAGGVRTSEPPGTGDATKIRYLTPSFGGFQLRVSYTPNLASINSGAGNGDIPAGNDIAAGDAVEAGGQSERDLGAVSLTPSFPNLRGEIKDEDAAGGGDYWQWQAGAVVAVGRVSLGGSYLREEVGGLEASAVTLGLGTATGPLKLSLAYGRLVDTDGLEANGNGLDEPSVVVLSGTLGLLPGLTLGGDLGYFGNDVDEEAEVTGDDGWEGVRRLAWEAADPLRGWRGKLLDVFESMARDAPRGRLIRHRARRHWTASWPSRPADRYRRPVGFRGDRCLRRTPSRPGPPSCPPMVAAPWLPVSLARGRHCARRRHAAAAAPVALPDPTD